LLNWNYSPDTDSVRPIKEVRLHLDLHALGVDGVKQARLLAPGMTPMAIPVKGGVVSFPQLGLWSVLEIKV
jgi:hypothetical protein